MRQEGRRIVVDRDCSGERVVVPAPAAQGDRSDVRLACRRDVIRRVAQQQRGFGGAAALRKAAATMSGSGFERSASSGVLRVSSRSAMPPASRIACSSCCFAEVATTHRMPSARTRSMSRRAPGVALRCGAYRSRKIACRRAAIDFPGSRSSSSERSTARKILSPPMPIMYFNRWNATTCPNSLSASAHAAACASLLRTSVPSTSRRSARIRRARRGPSRDSR